MLAWLQDVSWQRFGYPEMSGKDSTIWIGTEGAHTSCHKDSYGCNLIAQIYGRYSNLYIHIFYKIPVSFDILSNNFLPERSGYCFHQKKI